MEKGEMPVNMLAEVQEDVPQITIMETVRSVAQARVAMEAKEVMAVTGEKELMGKRLLCTRMADKLLCKA